MMVSTPLALLSSIAFSQAQFTHHKNGTITCDTMALSAFCTKNSSIIIRCYNGIGNPGNCNANLASYPPIGDNGLAGCYQSSHKAGDAACSKAGLVYPQHGSGASDAAPFPIPFAGTNSSSEAPSLANSKWNNTVGSNITVGTLLSGVLGAPGPTVTVTATKVVTTGCGDGTMLRSAVQNTPIAPHASSPHGHNYNASTVTLAPIAANTAVALAPGPQVNTSTIATFEAAPVYATGSYTINTPAAVATSLSTSTSASITASTSANSSAFTPFEGAASKDDMPLAAVMSFLGLAVFIVL